MYVHNRRHVCHVCEKHGSVPVFVLPPPPSLSLSKLFIAISANVNRPSVLNKTHKNTHIVISHHARPWKYRDCWVFWWQRNMLQMWTNCPSFANCYCVHSLMLIFGSCGFCVDGAESARHGFERSMCVFVWDLECVCDCKAGGVKRSCEAKSVKKKKERGELDDGGGAVGDQTTVIYRP